MVKKVLLGTLLVGLLAVLVVGAVNRTVAKTTDDVDTVQMQGRGRSELDSNSPIANGLGGQGQQGARGGSGETASTGQGGRGASGETRSTSRGMQGSAAQASGERQSQQEQLLGSRNGGSTGNGGNAGNGRQGNDGTVGAMPYAETEDHEWLSQSGIVQSLDADQMTIRTSAGNVQVTDRPWSFAREQGFQAQVGDQVSLSGFYEDGTFEVGELSNVSTGQAIQIREQSGRPLWAGGRGGQG